MKEKRLLKVFLLLFAFTFLFLGFTGCISITPPPTPNTGTVNITLSGLWSTNTYDIYMDGIYKGTTSTASFTINDVAPGTHTFEANQNIPGEFYASKTVTTNTGTNFVTLSPLLVVVMI